MRSPGRPPIRRDVERRFWVKIAEGLTSEDAAAACGVSEAVGTRWFRERGGVEAVDVALGHIQEGLTTQALGCMEQPLDGPGDGLAVRRRVTRERSWNLL